jgi:hypothetical protein
MLDFYTHGPRYSHFVGVSQTGLWLAITRESVTD